ncbi:4Fe-4S dicluster domain-containing protein, partial [candidate division KSB3 bacterium]|nr:4Fe-4S dicluster domain-containing protein [candidate division KSB3 bacterium]MBD3325576.1 4Fe-4S dicluster domain-containing protein [candidate division KSB3 bacterium]
MERTSPCFLREEEDNAPSIFTDLVEARVRPARQAVHVSCLLSINQEGSLMNHVLLLQPEHCIDCHSCQLACSLKHEGTYCPAKSRIEVLTSPLKFSVPLTCLQCEDPACAAVCVVNALKKNQETGIVDYDQDACIGCRMCVSACPFGNISYDRQAKA